MSKSIAIPAKRASLPSLGGVASITEAYVPIAVLAIVIALITPLPSFLLDLLIVLDIMLSVIVLMVSMNIEKPLEFSVFPTMLLLLTLFRLALNVSSSRLILLNGNSGTTAAGHVIEAFGSFVVGGNYIIGTVIFLVLIAIQYVVINHGAVRISEVTARFTLDALPGKQMAIDADLNAGLIDETQARDRRKQLAMEAEFHGAMDGASRFTQRDAVASILITGINIIAGFLIGVFQHDMELARALETYTVLTIGDGLVTVIPALMISISGGLIVARVNSEQKLGVDIERQLFGASQPLLLSSGVLLALAAFPGLPAVPFLVLGGGLGALAWRMRRKVAVTSGETSMVQAARETNKERLESLLKVEPITIEIGSGLTQLIANSPESPLIERLASVRRQVAGDLGYLLPPVRVNDNLSLPPQTYQILLKGVEIARFQFVPGHELAIPSGPADPGLKGKPTTDPAFGLPAVWISRDRIDRALALGYTVVDSISILGTHLAEVAKRHAHALLTRQDAKAFCDRVAQDQPKLVEDLVPKMLPTIQRVLQNLLREQVSIRDAVSILEAIGEAAVTTKNAVLMTEYVRQAIHPAIARPWVLESGELPAYLVDPAVEQMLESAVEHGEHNSVLTLAPQKAREILARVRQKVDTKDPAVLLTTPGVRCFLRQILEGSHPQIAVLSHNEIPAGVTVTPLGSI